MPIGVDRRAGRGGRGGIHAAVVAAVGEQDDAGDRRGRGSDRAPPAARRRARCGDRSRRGSRRRRGHAIAEPQDLGAKPRRQRRQQVVPTRVARARSMRRAPSASAEPHAARSVDQDGDDGVARAPRRCASTIGRIRQIDDPQQRREPQRRQPAAPPGRDRDVAVREPRDERGRADDGHERPQGKGISERHRLLSCRRDRLEVFRHALLVGVGHALAAAGAQPVLGDRARRGGRRRSLRRARAPWPRHRASDCQAA